MGCCSSCTRKDGSNLIYPDVVYENPDLLEKSEVKNFKIFISYCWSDEKIAHQLNKDLKKLKSSLEINLDKQSLNIERIIPYCDLFIACLSESYMESFDCQREAFMAANFHVPIFLLSINGKFKLDKNKASIIFGNQIEKLSKNKILSYSLSKVELIKEIEKLRNRLIKNRQTPYDKILAQKKTDKLDREHNFAKFIERNWRLTTSLQNNNLWRNYVGFPGPERTEKDMDKRKRLDNDLSIMKEKRIKLSKFFNDRYKNCPLDTFCVFAERMLQNSQDFEDFCKNYEKNN